MRVVVVYQSVQGIFFETFRNAPLFSQCYMVQFLSLNKIVFTVSLLLGRRIAKESCDPFAPHLLGRKVYLAHFWITQETGYCRNIY